MNGHQTVSEVFAQSLYRIPDFQRGYSWTKEQLGDFWMDLQILQEGTRLHYFGVLTVEDGTQRGPGFDWGYESWLVASGEYKPYVVVDGQQRLTTVLLLIAAIVTDKTDDTILNYQTIDAIRQKYLFRENPSDGTRGSLLTYDDNDESAAMLRSLLVEHRPIGGAQRTLYNRNLTKAFEFFRKKVSDVSQAELESIFRRLTNQFVFNVYKVADDFDVHVTFETMNNRGKRLSTLELLKNRLIYLSTLTQDGPGGNALRKEINDTWRSIYSYLGRDARYPLGDDAFLRSHWIMHFTDLSLKPSEYADHLLKSWFTAPKVRSGEVTAHDITNYLRSLGKAAEPWFKLQVPPEVSGASEEIAEWLLRLQWLGWGNGEPVALAALLRESDRGRQAEVFCSIERFIFLVNRVSSRRSDTQQSTFHKLAKDLYAGRLDSGQVSDKIGIVTDGPHGYYRTGGLLEQARILFRDADGFYSWNELRYVLYEYEQHLRERANGTSRLSAYDAMSKKLESSVEHVLPQKPTHACWTSQFAQDGQLKRYINSLGNLVLINRTKNGQLRNGCFDYKCHAVKQDGTKVGYDNGTYSEMELVGYGHWDKGTILDRGKRILSFMRTRWNMELPTDQEESILLGQ